MLLFFQNIYQAIMKYTNLEVPMAKNLSIEGDIG